MSQEKRQHYTPAPDEVEGGVFSTDKSGLTRELISPEQESTHKQAISQRPGLPEIEPSKSGPATLTSNPKKSPSGLSDKAPPDTPEAPTGHREPFTYEEHSVSPVIAEAPATALPSAEQQPRNPVAPSGGRRPLTAPEGETVTPRYGSVERAEAGRMVVGGAGGDAIAGDTAEIIRTPEQGVQGHKDLIKDTPENLFKEQIAAHSGVPTSEGNPSQGAAYASKTWGIDKLPRKGFFRTAGRIASREVEREITQGTDGDVEGRAAGQSIKYGYKAGKLATTAATQGAREAYHLTRYGIKLKSDVAEGAMTSKDALTSFASQIKSNASGSLTSLGGLVKTGLGRAVADFHGSDDLGMQAITKPKDAIIQTKRTLQVGKATARSLTKGFKAIPKAAQRVQQVSRAVVAVGKKLLSNPLVMKGVAVAAGAVFGVFMLFGVISGIISVFTSMSLKSPDYELTKTYLYITELDARMQQTLTAEDTPGIGAYTYYVNGVEVARDAVKVYTDADVLLMYFDSKYDDYTFDGATADGSSVRAQIGTFHAALHQVNLIRQTEEVTGENGTEIITRLCVYLTTIPTRQYLDANKATLLTQEEQDKFAALEEAGPYSFRQELATPFVGIDWLPGVTSRFGWRIHPITGALSTHNALDIAMAGGTPINACMSGTAVVPGYHESYGNYVKVVAENGTYTLYAHMSRVAVTNGQTISTGDVIGYVGTTGSSTGNHLHLEYFKDGHILNPLFFVAH